MSVHTVVHVPVEDSAATAASKGRRRAISLIVCSTAKWRINVFEFLCNFELPDTTEDGDFKCYLIPPGRAFLVIIFI